MDDILSKISEYMKVKHDKDVPIHICKEALQMAKRDGEKQGWNNDQVFGATINCLKNLKYNISA